ncbi:hypothetical protein SAMN05216324_11923 [Chryseobacterium limigenitum]|uniref:Uncharacterized protein n=1 Tax=Chryseobacterium limigenitum TaxID=1612149 RepID=A0A1K2IVJ0_9FLAO|nr:hypothetical protein SAMN05216324_11923 [Chryseobacterium limigenitum]
MIIMNSFFKINIEKVHTILAKIPTKIPIFANV